MSPSPRRRTTSVGPEARTLGANLTRGNSEVTNVTTGLEVAYLRDRDRWRARGSVLRTTTDGEETANRIRSVLQYDLFPTDHGYIFARGTGMSNRPAGIRNRFVVGTGGGYDVVRRDRLGVSLEAGATHLTEEFVDRTTDDHFNVLAAQNLEFEVGEDTRLTQNLEVQPRVDDLSDVVAEAQAALSTTLVGDLGLRVSITADYESEPFDPADEEPRESLDTTFVTGITYTF